MAIMEVNSNNFDQEVLSADRPVVVDFNAGWCGPCRMLKPVLEELSDARGDYKFVSVDIDEDVELAERYDVSSIPCLVVFKNGAEHNRSIGFQPQAALDALLDE
ncbi:MAG: thioredoxin [Oscillospiraceae bacterium]|nr:thioredoxin [Oscillospiraceae bacterium]